MNNIYPWNVFVHASDPYVLFYHPLGQVFRYRLERNIWEPILGRSLVDKLLGRQVFPLLKEDSMSIYYTSPIAIRIFWLLYCSLCFETIFPPTYLSFLLQ